MTNSNTTITETLARVTDLEGQLATAQQESIRAQALAIAQPRGGTVLEKERM